jgi:phosphoribosylformylglycinamidine (FGAM) synthase-like enzyme
MAFAGGYGLDLDLGKVPGKDLERNDFVLFSESNSRFLLEVAENDRKEFEALMKGKSCALIGKVTKDERLVVNGLSRKIVVEASLAQLRRAWKKTLSGES